MPIKLCQALQCLSSLTQPICNELVAPNCTDGQTGVAAGGVADLDHRVSVSRETL